MRVSLIADEGLSDRTRLKRNKESVELLAGWFLALEPAEQVTACSPVVTEVVYLLREPWVSDSNHYEPT
jgi:hypothetical protein